MWGLQSRFWGYIGIMEKNMETTILGYMGSWGGSSAFCCLQSFRFALVKDDNGGPFPG